jgi:hypothetical protein
MFKILLTISMVFACSRFSHPATKTVPDPSPLDIKAELYKTASKAHQDAHGFLTTGCDSLLFTALLAATAKPEIDVLAARDGEGAWHRRPDAPCFPENSRSEISRDMITGVMFWALFQNRADVLEDLRAYGKAHNWTMGLGDTTRTVMSANIITLIDMSIDFLHGRPVAEKDFIFFSLPAVGYAAHLQTLQILMIGKIKGSISPYLFKAATRNLKNNPRNALYQYTVAKYSTGVFSTAVNTLLDESLFPSDNLPTTVNHCTEYLWQRDLGKDWEPCAEFSEHTGTDFLFVYGLLKNG